MDDVIDKACEAAGGLTKLAAAIGQTAQAVSNWRARGVPVVHCAEIERVTGGSVTRRDLRPDDWQRIWPELTGSAGAPPVPAEQGEAADAA